MLEERRVMVKNIQNFFSGDENVPKMTWVMVTDI